MGSAVPFRHLWSPERLSADDMRTLLQTAAMLKGTRRRAEPWRPLQGRHLVVLCSAHADAGATFQRAVADLGGVPVLLNADEWRRRAGDHLADEARLLGQLYDAIDCCDLPMATIEQIEAHSGVPVANGLSSSAHPLSLVADILTIREAAAKPLHMCKLAVAAYPGPREESDVAATMARLAGMQAVVREEPVASGEADASDFILDPAARVSAARLKMPHGTPADQERLGKQVQANRQYALEAALVCGLQ